MTRHDKVEGRRKRLEETQAAMDKIAPQVIPGWRPGYCGIAVEFGSPDVGKIRRRVKPEHLKGRTKKTDWWWVKVPADWLTCVYEPGLALLHPNNLTLEARPIIKDAPPPAEACWTVTLADFGLLDPFVLQPRFAVRFGGVFGIDAQSPGHALKNIISRVQNVLQGREEELPF